MPESSTVVIIDTDHAYLDLMEEILRDEGYRASTWHGSSGALDFVKVTQPNVIILDSWLSTPDEGRSLLRQLSADPTTRSIPVIVVTSDPLFSERGPLPSGSEAVLDKPFDVTDLVVRLRRAINRSPDGRSSERLESRGEANSE